MALALRERLGRLHETAAAVGILFEIHVRFPSAYPGSPEGATGTSSLGEFGVRIWAHGGAEQVTQASTIPWQCPIWGRVVVGKRGRAAAIFTLPSRGRVATPRDAGG